MTPKSVRLGDASIDFGLRRSHRPYNASRRDALERKLARLVLVGVHARPDEAIVDVLSEPVADRGVVPHDVTVDVGAGIEITAGKKRLRPRFKIKDDVLDLVQQRIGRARHVHLDAESFERAGDTALSGHSPATSAAEASYFLLAEPGDLLTVLNAVLTGFLTAQGKTRFAGFAASVGCLACIVRNPLLIFGLGPLPALGISGAALANIGCGAVNGILLAFAILRDPLFAQGLHNHDGPFRFAFARPIVRLGLPQGFNTLSGAAAFTTFVFATGRLGGLPAAAGNVVFAVNGVFFCLLLALAPAVEILAGRARGGADIPTVRRICRSGLLLAGLALGLCYAMILPMSNVIMDTFRPTGSAFDPALWRHVGLVLFTILFFREIAESALLVLRGVLNGLGETRSVMRIQMIMDLFVWTPTVLLLMHTTHSVLAIWLTLPVNLAVTALLLHRRLRGATGAFQSTGNQR